MLRCFGKLIIPNDDAKIISDALSPDNTEWCKNYCENDNLIVEVDTRSVSSLLNTVEDFFLNIKAAVFTLNVLNSFIKNNKGEK